MALPMGLTNPFDSSSLKGTLPGDPYQSALEGLQPPQQEPVPQISLPQIITTALMATLAGSLADSPELAAQSAAEPFMRQEAVKARNVARQDEYEKQRALLLREGAREQSTAERQAEVANIRAESAGDVARVRAEVARDLEAGRSERARLANELNAARLAIAEGRLEDAQARTRIQATLAETMNELRRIRGVEATARTKNLSEADTKEFRSYARDYVAQAVTAIQNTPAEEDVTWTMYLPDRNEELSGAEEIKSTILAYIDSTMKGSPGYEKVRSEAEQALDEAIRARQ